MRAATARAPGAPRRLVRRTLQVLAALALLAPAFAAADLVFTSDPPRDAEVDRPYVYTMAAADDEDDDDDRRRPRGPAVRFFVLDSPAWLAFDGTDTLSGTPRERDVGGHRVRLTARRRGETASQTFTITVRSAPAGPAPRPPPPPPASGSADLAVSISVSPNPVLTAASHTWSVEVSHLGGSHVANLELSITLDAPASYRIGDISDPACAPSADAVVTCRWSALEAGTTRSAALEGLAGDAGTVTATAAVSILDPTVDDPDDGNDRASAVLNVTAGPTVEPIQTLAAEGARGLAVADLDGDGHDDLAVAAASAVLVFARSPDEHGRPFGTPPVAVEAAAGGAAIAAADLDANGRIDLAVARPDAASIVLFAAESGGFEAVTLDGFTGARAAAIGDVDGDSLPDVALADDASIVVYRNLGARVFAEPETVATRPAAVLAAADLTGDGRAELAAGGADGAVEVYRRGTDGYALAAAPQGAPSSSLALADVDGDGVPDLAVGSRSDADTVLLARNGGSLSFAAAAGVGGGSATVGILLADFDSDGLVDVATLDASGVHRIHRHDGASPPGFELLPHRFTGAPDPIDAAVGLFDFDAIPDVAVATGDGVEIFVNVGQPLPPGAPRLVLNGEPTVILTVGDEYVDPGASAYDDVDGDLTGSIVVTNPVDTQTIGSYIVTYEVEDSSGNKAAATRTVEVRARAASGGGGGGIAGLDMLALLCLSVAASRIVAGGRAGLAGPGRLSLRSTGQSAGWTDRSAR